MTREIVLFVLLFLALLGLVIFFRRSENRYLKLKTKDSVSQDLKAEIEKERSENLLKKQKFEEALQKAKFPLGS